VPISNIFTQSNYFSSYIDIKSIAEPSNPSSGIGRVFYSTSTGKISFKKSNGTVVDLESGGGGGGAPTDASYVTLATDATLSAERVLAVSSPLTLTDGGAGSNVTVGFTSTNVKLDDLGTPDDNTDLNASTTKHGLLLKLSGNSTDFLTGQGTWAVPSGSGSGGGTAGGTSTQSGDAVTTVFTIAHGLGETPNAVSVEPSSVDAIGDYQVDFDATNITITYQVAPPNDTDNLVWIWIASVGGSGEANTYSNAGAGGVGIVLTKVGVDLPFKSINTANSSNITVTNDAGNSEIDLDIGADVITTTNTKTLTNKTILDSGTGNQIGVHIPHTFTIYHEGSNIIVRNNITGTKQSFSNTDIAPALEWAANNIVNVGTGQDAHFGGSIFIKKGRYQLITECSIGIDDTTRHGIGLYGEGRGTTIEMSPAGALTNGFLVEMMSFEMYNINIIANANVTNLIQIYNNQTDSGWRSDFIVLDHVYFFGPNANYGMGSGTPISGQKGIYVSTGMGPPVQASFFSEVTGCKFYGLDHGIHLTGANSNAWNIHDNDVQLCRIGVEISGSAGQNIIDGMWIQGTYAVGTTGIYLNTTGGNNIVDNINGELGKTDDGTAPPTGTSVNCETILIASGVSNQKIGRNITNSYHGLVDFPNAITIRDNSGNFTNGGESQLNVENTSFIRFDKTNSYITFDSSKLALFANAQVYIGDSDSSGNYIIRGGDISAGGSKHVNLPNITFGDADPTFVLDNVTQTMTNKTLTTPTIAQILNGAGTLTLPTSTDTLVGRATTDTMTNKTLTTPTLTTPTVNGVKYPLPAAKTANYTATATDYYIPVDTTSGNLTVNLPAVSGLAGTTYVIYKTDSSANTVTINPDSTETINGVSTLILKQRYQHIIVECTGSEWIALRGIRYNDDTTSDTISFPSAVVKFGWGQLITADSVGTADYVIYGGNLSGVSRLFGFPDLSGNDKFVAEAATQTLTNKTIGDLKETWQSKSTTYTMAQTDFGIFLTGTGTYTVTLPAAASSTGRIFKFLKTGASGTVTIDGNASETINGAANITITIQYQLVELICDGSAWFAHRMSA
jgi:hypothetical protein